MIESNASYSSYQAGGQLKVQQDRLPAGPALLAVFGLSLVGWVFVLVPLVAMLHH